MRSTERSTLRSQEEKFNLRKRSTFLVVYENMAKLVTYSEGEYGERRRERRSENCFGLNWRPSKLVLVPSTNVNLIMNSGNNEIHRHRSFFRQNRLQALESSTSEYSLKSVHRTISEYWRDVLRYHWPIAIQSFFLAIVIITMGPWVGLSCNEDISSEERSLMWRFPIITELKTVLDYTSADIPEPNCGHGFCCFSKNIEGSSIRRRASFLKRKRITKAFDTF